MCDVTIERVDERRRKISGAASQTGERERVPRDDETDEQRRKRPFWLGRGDIGGESFTGHRTVHGSVRIVCSVRDAWGPEHEAK